MSIISYDGQSIIIGGRRIWLVGGAIDYARTPHELWLARIRAAKLAGLNCIWTSAVWRRHEPEPEAYDFSGDADIRSFIKIIGEHGMYCVLRAGPYVGDTWDLGGLPGWLLQDPTTRLREPDPVYLNACGRYFSKLLDQVNDLQINPNSVAAESASDRIEAPIVMVQSEQQWLCHNPKAAEGYLGELVRYLREHGCTVPIAENNNLWSITERTIPCWSGSEHLAADLRQLHQVQPNAPRIVADCSNAAPTIFGAAPEPAAPANRLLRRLASVLAVGAQYCVSPFHGGTHFGFDAGRAAGHMQGSYTTSNDRGGPLDEPGNPGPSYAALKTISTFASQFGHVFAHLDSEGQHAAVAIDADQSDLSVFDQSGAQGRIVFLIQGDQPRDGQIEILLNNGLTLPVALGADQVAWIMTDTVLGGTATLNYTNLRPWAFLDKQLLVLFGPPASEGIVCINGNAIHATVPSGKTPLVEQVEGITVAILNADHLGGTYLTNDTVIIGAAGLDDAGQPLPMDGSASAVVLDAGGTLRRRKTQEIPSAQRAPKLTGWMQASLEPLISGESDRYKAIDGPSGMESLGVHDGYGWYRVACRKNPASAAMLPYGAGRLHIYQGGHPVALAGDGPGASVDPVDLEVAGTLVVFADNPGRASTGWRYPTAQGVTDPLYAASKVGLTQLKMRRAQPPNLFDLRGFLPQASTGLQGATKCFTWTVKPVGANPIYIQINGLPARAVVTVDDVMVGAYDPVQNGRFERITLREGSPLRRGQNTVSLSLLNTDVQAPDLDRTRFAKHVEVFQGTKNLTSRAAWSFARWAMPSDDDFQPMPRKVTPGPRWFRSLFSTKRNDAPLWFDPQGLSKGQIFLNGRNLGRYFVATASGQPVLGQTRYYLPEPWVHTDKPNQITIFDEHGRSPQRCLLDYGPTGSTGRPSASPL